MSIRTMQTWQSSFSDSGASESDKSTKPSDSDMPSRHEESHIFKSKMYAQFRKTTMCKFEIMGLCRKGAQCPYAHDPAELQKRPDLSCTKICPEFTKTGRCSQADCSYAHSADELRATNLFKKTKPCRFWPTGHCNHGHKCRFAHIDAPPSAFDTDYSGQSQEQFQDSSDEFNFQDDLAAVQMQGESWRGPQGRCFTNDPSTADANCMRPPPGLEEFRQKFNVHGDYRNNQVRSFQVKPAQASLSHKFEPSLQHKLNSSNRVDDLRMQRELEMQLKLNGAIEKEAAFKQFGYSNVGHGVKPQPMVMNELKSLLDFFSESQ